MLAYRHTQISVRFCNTTQFDNLTVLDIIVVSPFRWQGPTLVSCGPMYKAYSMIIWNWNKVTPNPIFRCVWDILIFQSPGTSRFKMGNIKRLVCENKLTNFRRHASRVHFASNSFGPIHLALGHFRLYTFGFENIGRHVDHHVQLKVGHF